MEEVEDKMKTALMKTTEKPHYNGWSNRTQFGYHSFDFYNIHIPGQRIPLKRLEKLNKFCNFAGAKVLDLGCNTGGMLFHLPEIYKGVGIDFDKTCIDACEVFKHYMNYSWDLKFFVHDLNEFVLEEFCILNKFMPDYIFLLSLGSWVKNWKTLYESAYECSSKIVLEINNVQEGMAQLKLFETFGAKITLVSDNSDDDTTGNHGRKMYLIEKQEKPEN